MTVKDLASEYGLDEYDDAYKDKGCLSCCTCFNCSRGGGVRCLVIWDMISFGLATLFFYGSYKLESENFLEAKGHIYFTKWIYGCLSFPFLCFSLPILNGLLSRARPTAYD